MAIAVKSPIATRVILSVLLINFFLYSVSNEGCAGGFLNHAVHTVAHMRVAGRKHYHFVLLCAPIHVVFRTLALALNQHFKGFAHIVAVAAQRQLVLQGNHAVQTVDFHIFGHVVGQSLGGIGARSLAILEHER